jgi:hypothetical protein
MFNNIKVFNKVDNYDAVKVLPTVTSSTCCLLLAGFLFGLHFDHEDGGSTFH